VARDARGEPVPWIQLRFIAIEAGFGERQYIAASTVSCLLSERHTLDA
jgi:hypothetical protein